MNGLVDGYSKVVEHISLGICVSPKGEPMSLGICVSLVEKHKSLVICVSLVEEHVSLGYAFPRKGNTSNW